MTYSIHTITYLMHVKRDSTIFYIGCRGLIQPCLLYELEAGYV